MPAIVPAQAEALAERARVDARLELYAADGRLCHLFGQFFLEAAEAFAHAGRFSGEVPSKTRSPAVGAG